MAISIIETGMLEETVRHAFQFSDEGLAYLAAVVTHQQYLRKYGLAVDDRAQRCAVVEAEKIWHNRK